MNTASKPAIAGIHHIAFNVPNFDDTVKFYCGVLGMKEAVSWRSGDKRCVMLDTGDGSRIEMFETFEPQTEAAGAYQHFALRSQNCDEVIRKVKAAGMTVTIEPNDVVLPGNPPLPIRIAFFKGPFGETIEIFQEK